MNTTITVKLDDESMAILNELGAELTSIRERLDQHDEQLRGIEGEVATKVVDSLTDAFKYQRVGAE